MTRPSLRRGPRHGVAAVEMAALMPFLLYLCLLAVDYGRIAFSAVTLTNAARNAAMFEADPILAATLPYQSAREAAEAEAADLPALPEVVTARGTDSEGHDYVEATVTSTFQTLVRYPGIPDSITLRRTVRMPVPPS